MSRGVLAAAAATGILSLSYSSAFADADAAGTAKDSPGVLAGNTVQAPVDAPVNVCGNTVNGIAALNAAFGNKCENDESPEPSKSDVPDAPRPSATPKPSDDCSETPKPSPTPPTRVVEKPRPTPPPPPTRSSHTPTPPRQHLAEPPQLAETGSRTMLATSAASAALIAGGVMMYRRGRTAARR